MNESSSTHEGQSQARVEAAACTRIVPLVLEARGLSTTRGHKNITFALRHGEIQEPARKAGGNGLDAGW